MDVVEARKFSFDTVFSEDGAVLRDAGGYRAQFNAEEMEELKAQAFEAGRRDETAKAEHAAAQALAQLSQRIGQLLQRLDADANARRAETLAVAMAIARKVAGAALDAFGEARVVAAVEHAMVALPASPRLVVRVAPGLVAAVRPRLEQAAAEQGYAGAIAVRAADAASPGDVEIEWADGAIGHDREETLRRVEEIIDQSLTTDDADQDDVS